MPGPYALHTDRVTGGPDPANDQNALAAALNESTPNATANLLILRDANGRAKVADPAVGGDIVNKNYADGLPFVPKSLYDVKGDLLVGTADDTMLRLAVGADGLFLMTDSSQPSGLRYAAPDFSSMIPKSLVDAKGDLLAASADNLVGRLPIGTNGQVLTADSAQTLGMKWATPSGGGGTPSPQEWAPMIPIYAPINGWQPMWRSNGRGGDVTLQSTLAHAAPFLPSRDFSADQLTFYTNTAVASSTGRFAVYASNATNTGPGALITDWGTVATTVSGITTLTFSSAQAFTGGTLYWIAFLGGATGGAALVGVQTWAYQAFPDDNYNAVMGGGSTTTAMVMTAGAAYPSTWTNAVSGGPHPDPQNFPTMAFRRSA